MQVLVGCMSGGVGIQGLSIAIGVGTVAGGRVRAVQLTPEGRGEGVEELLGLAWCAR